MQLITSVSSLAASDIAQSKADPKKIHDAAQQFESLMIGEMLKSVRENSSSGWMGSEAEEDNGGDSAMGMAESQFANALALGGGLGLSRMIERSVSSEATAQNEKPSPSALSSVSAK